MAWTDQYGFDEVRTILVRHAEEVNTEEVNCGACFSIIIVMPGKVSMKAWAVKSDFRKFHY
jgi:hypothetical protein